MRNLFLATTAALFLTSGVTQAQLNENCNAWLSARQQAISYEPRTPAAQLAGLADELKEITDAARALESFVTGIPGPAREAAIAGNTSANLLTAAAALSAGQRLQAAIMASSDDRTALRQSYEQARTAFWTNFLETRADTLTSVIAPLQRGRRATPAERGTAAAIFVREMDERQLERLNAARSAVHQLEEAERAARLVLDEAPLDSPERVAAQTAYYQALVGQSAAQTELRAASTSAGLDFLVDRQIYWEKKPRCRPGF